MELYPSLGVSLVLGATERGALLMFIMSQWLPGKRRALSGMVIDRNARLGCHLHPQLRIILPHSRSDLLLSYCLKCSTGAPSVHAVPLAVFQLQICFSCSSLLSVSAIKHADQEQPEEERVYLAYFQVIILHWGKSGKKTKAETMGANSLAHAQQAPIPGPPS